MTTFTATYSPDDNKLRLYASGRLDADLYQRVRAAGFRWAPRQELFVAPTWTPAREDLLLELAGQVDDEDKSLVERQAERAERFEAYSESRVADYHAAHRAVAAIADNIPLGQPILVGHHSERRARKDAERIDSGMRRAVKMWDTAKYWTDRAASALAHARYKELPQVRARRVKTIEADQRKVQRTLASTVRMLKAYAAPGFATAERNGKNVRHAVLSAGWGCGLSYEDSRAVELGTLSDEAALAKAVANLERNQTACERWLAHYANRLAYERAMLGEQGATHLLEKAPRPKQPPLCNYRTPAGLDIENQWNRGTLLHYAPVEMTSAEYAKLCRDYKGTRVVGNSHRVRIAYRAHTLQVVFLTDSKVHTPPAAVAPAPRATRNVGRISVPAVERPEPSATEAEVDKLRQAVAAGVKVVAAPELFVTPAALADRMVALAGVRAGHRVLEPSAGTGALVKAAQAAGAEVTAVELNHSMAQALGARCADFLDLGAAELGRFDRVVMNPPFSAEVAHVEHAAQMLKPGGRLVAVMSAAVTFRSDRKYSAFRRQVDELGGTIEPLPDDTFKAAGTGVRTVLVVIDAPRQALAEVA